MRASEIRDRLERDGFAVLERFVAPADCDALRERAGELVAAFDPPARRSVFTTDEQQRHSDAHFFESADEIRFFFEPRALGPNGALLVPKERALNKIGHALHDLDPAFDRFSRAPALRALAGELGLANALLMQSMYLFKQPRIGGEVAVHQDATFLLADPPRILGLWFALEDATVQNGCLWAEPGGHKRGLARRFEREGDRTRFVELQPPRTPDELVPLEVPKGALVLLDGLCPHLSRENTSERSRHAYTLHLVPAGARWLPQNWLQRRAERPARSF